MSDSSEMGRVDFIAGQVHALLGFALALINTHPDVANLQAHYDALDLGSTAKAGAESMSDDFLEGMEDIALRLKTTAEAARKRKGSSRISQPR